MARQRSAVRGAPSAHGETGDEHRRAALAEFVSRCRKALPVPAAGRRRTPGWRREEVAAAAGVSTTWFTWLEQGRDISVSEPALARLARVLRLDTAQATYLFDLARPRAVVAQSGAVDPELVAFVDGVSPLPAYALDRSWTVIAANAAARRILSLEAGESLIEKLFLDPAWRALFENWKAIARSSVAQYRASVGGRPEYRGHVERLLAQSADFARLWEVGEVEGAPLWRKVIAHPRLGRLTTRYAAFAADNGTGTSLSIYTPADEATRKALGRM